MGLMTYPLQKYKLWKTEKSMSFYSKVSKVVQSIEEWLLSCLIYSADEVSM